MSRIEKHPTSNYFTSNIDIDDIVIIKNSRWIYLIVGITLGYASYWSFTHEMNPEIIGYILAFTLSIFSLIGFGNFLDRRPQLRLDKRGIYILREGLIEWKNIESSFIEIEDTSDGDTSSHTYYLVLELKSKKTIKSMISNLSKDVDWIANTFEGFRIRYSDSGLYYKLKR